MTDISRVSEHDEVLAGRAMMGYQGVYPGQSRPDIAQRNPLPPQSSHPPQQHPPVHPTAGGVLSRSTRAKMLSAGLHPVLMAGGAAPVEVNPRAIVGRGSGPGIIPAGWDGRGQPPAEFKPDKYRRSEITVQFLAIAGASESRPPPERVHFTFQFYNFPAVKTERLLALAEPGDKPTDPHVLVREATPAGSHNRGLQVTFVVDPAFQRPDEDAHFASYLAHAAGLHVELWDSASMMAIGGARVPLGALARGGLEAVQQTDEYELYDPMSPGAAPHGGLGRIHLRIAHVGRPSAAPAATAASLQRGVQFVRGEAELGRTGRRRRIAKARPLVATHPELLAQLKENRVLGPASQAGVTTLARGGAAPSTVTEYERKAQRVEKLREARSVLTSDKGTTIGETRLQRLRDLRIIAAFREKVKSDMILNLLKMDITATITLHPTFGQMCYFEFPLQNPYRRDQNIVIDIEGADGELSLVTRGADAAHLRRVFAINQGAAPVEDDLFDDGCRVYLEALELVQVPFRFQSFASGAVPFDPRSMDSAGSAAMVLREGPAGGDQHAQSAAIAPRQVRVVFRSEESGQPLYILVVEVQPHPFVVTNTVRFHHPEGSMLQAVIPLPPLPALPAGHQPLRHLACDSSSVVATSVAQGVDIKARVSLGVERFHLCVYSDPQRAVLTEVIEVVVCGLLRHDITCSMGETARGSLIVRGTSGAAAPMVCRAYSSDPSLKVDPQPFSVVAGALNEVPFSVTPEHQGYSTVRVHLVDEATAAVVAAWAVAVHAQPALLSKAFDLHVPLGSALSKKVSYPNPFAQQREFHIRTDRPDLVSFKESIILMGPNEAKFIGLRFQPRERPLKASATVFINDAEGRNLDAFALNISYG